MSERTFIDDRHHPELPTSVRRALNELAPRIERELPRGWGFGLLLFSYTVTDQAQYLGWIASGRREDMMNVMCEFLRRHGRTTLDPIETKGDTK